MLNLFPDLLAFGMISPLILRVTLGVIFIYFGSKKLGSERARKSEFFESLGLRPGKYYAIVVGLIELIAGILLIAGLYTQATALTALVISIVAVFLKKKQPESFTSSFGLLFLLAVISLSLLFTGAGFFAFDWPL